MTKELTDDQIDNVLPLGMAPYLTLCGPTEIRRFARAVIAADRAARISEYPALPPAGRRGPDGTGSYFDAYTADQMRTYAAQAVEVDRAARGVPDEETRQAVQDAVADALGDAYDCMRVWSAWGVGTMGPDDFCLVSEDDDRVAEIADAAINAMLAAAPQPAEQPVCKTCAGRGYFDGNRPGDYQDCRDCAGDPQPAAQPEHGEQERDAIAELNHAQWIALENVRLLAARHRKEDWAQHMLRFCDDAGIRSQAIHRAQTQPAAQPERKPMTREQVDELAEDGVFLRSIYEIVRAVEVAHGIKDTP